MGGLTLRYYDAGMRYLGEATKEFAQAHPDHAVMLDLGKAGIPDSYAERLFEGFAFSMGRLHAKIDDHFLEFTEGLVNLLWPRYLHTIPSLSIVELLPDIDMLKMSERINAKFGILSQPVDLKKAVCQYRTTQSVTPNPLSVATVNVDAEPDGRSIIRMWMGCNPQMDWSQTDLTCLSLYLSSDAPVTHALHLALVKRLASPYLGLPNNVERIRLEGFFSPGGFADEGSL